jgi:pyrroline-5-carboxylate reductase
MRVGLIGAGNMASALARGWGEPILCTDAIPARAQALVDELGGEVVVSNAELAERADAVFLCHKPDQLEAVATELTRVGGGEGAAIVSILGGVSLDALRSAYPGRRVTRLMPNVAAEVGQGVICMAAESDAPDGLVELLERAATVEVIPEKLMEAATAVMGVGPAYVSLFVEAQVDAAVRLGMPPDLAARLATQTAAGTAKLLAQHDYDTLAVRRMVTSPGGSTARGLAALEEGGVRAAFQAAAEAVVHGGKR